MATSDPTDRPPPDRTRPRSRSSNALGGLAGLIADAAVRGVDLNAAVDEVDLDAQIQRVDVNALLDRVDPDRLLDRVDVDRLLDHVDVDRLLEHADVDRLLEQVDVNRLLDRVDVDRLLDRADPDRLLDRVDVDRLVQRAGIADIIAQSTAQVTGGVLDGLRRQIVALDLILMRTLYRLTGRRFDRLPAGPAELVDQTADPVLRADEIGVPIEMAGRYAGLLTRVLSLGVDLGVATGIYTVFTAGIGWVVNGVLGLDLQGGLISGIGFGIGLVAWWALYWIGALAVSGRTPGMGLIGLRLLRDDGEPLSPLRVAIWTLFLPVSTIFFVGFALMLVGNRRRTLHDRMARACVVYDWGRRGRHADAPLARWIAEH